jgi:glycosyltransferase involved in cell wall biosynthesis
MGGMRVTVVHNRYSGRVPSGENLSVDQHAGLMAPAVHVTVVGPSNEDFLTRPVAARAGVALASLGTRGPVQRWRRAVAATEPDCVHVENTVPFVPEGLVSELLADGVPVLRRWRSFRFRCMVGEGYRAGQPCTACSGRVGGVPGVVHGCYAGSRVASAMVALRRRPEHSGSSLVHIPNSHFLAGQLLERGVPDVQVRVVPNWVPLPVAAVAPVRRNDEVLFVGVLAERKGVGLLLDAWRRRPRRSGLRLRVVGDGPMAPAVHAAAAADPSITVEGPVDYPSARARIAEAAVVVVPSLWDEPFGRVAAEGLAEGTPVVVSDRGGLPEVVDASCGWQVPAGDVDAWAEALVEVAGVADGEHAAMAERGRARYQARYSPDAVRTQWHQLYGQLIEAGR